MAHIALHCLDVRGLLCPLPVIRLQDKASEFALDEKVQVKVICSDPGVLHDIPAWCRLNGHHVVSVHEDENEIIFIVELEPYND